MLRISRPTFMACFALALASNAPSATQAPEPEGVMRTARSGAWSNRATWEKGRVPSSGDRVLIREGHEVLYNVQSDVVIRGIHIAGMLRFAADRDTRLEVGLIRIQASDRYSEDGFDCEAHVSPPPAGGTGPAMLVGTPTRPIGAEHTAIIRLH